MVPHGSRNLFHLARDANKNKRGDHLKLHERGLIFVLLNFWIDLIGLEDTGLGEKKGGSCIATSKEIFLARKYWQ